MIGQVLGFITLLGVFGASTAMGASDVDALADNLRAYGFSTCDTTGTLRTCTRSGTLPDGKSHAVNVMAIEQPSRTL